MSTEINRPISDFINEVRRLVAARASLVFVETYEEQRLERLLHELAESLFSQSVPLFLWSITEGLGAGGEAEPFPGTEAPDRALEMVLAHPRPALFLFRDLHRHFDEPRVMRRLRDVQRALQRSYKTLFVCGTESVPAELHREVSVLELPMPNVVEMAQIFSEVAAASPRTQIALDDEQRDALTRGALGLSEQEARLAFARLLVGHQHVGPEIIDELHGEKRSIVRKEGILDYVPQSVSLEQIGGLSTLKRWLGERQRFFSEEAEVFGLDPPKGLLVTGISGCGKSMAVQAVASFWRMPLIRLDLNRIYAAISGSPEATLERALSTAEAIAPCVLWIDEIETAIVGTHGEASAATRIFSSFLTWMQEKRRIVFVAATANKIDQLPPELLRKGRFDEVFFVDLPSQEERMEILSVHLVRRDKDPAAFDLLSLSKATANFNGAELEQIVLSGMFTAFSESRELTMKDLYRALGNMVPLATTMSERIKEIKRWADRRAIRAG